MSSAKFEARLMVKSELSDAQKFYRSQGHFAAVQPADNVFGVWKEGKLTAICRVAPEFHTTQIKGLVIEKSSDEAAVLQVLIPAISEHLGKLPFCALIDEAKLKVWKDLGLKPMKDEDLSGPLLQRRDHGLQRDKKLVWVACTG